MTGEQGVVEPPDAGKNVEIVRRIYDAARGRDAATIFALYDPEVELDTTSLDGVGVYGVYRGHEGLRRFFRDWHEAWEGIDYDYDELLAAGEEHVISIVTRRGRGRASGVEAGWHLALLWTLREGRVVRVAWHRSREEALATVRSEA